MRHSFSIDHVDQPVKTEATRSLLIILVISFLPLLIGLLASITQDLSPSNIASQAWRIFLNGELYFYAVSLSASIYTTSQLTEHRQHLGMRLWSGLFVICCIAFMAAYVGQLNGDIGSNATIHGPISAFFLVGAVIMNYRVMVLAGNPPPSPEVVNRERTAELLDEVEVEYDQ